MPSWRDNPAVWENWLRRMYGLSSVDFLAILASQNEKCGMCRRPFRSGRVTHGKIIDHCHTSGFVRGIVCAECNRQLAYLDLHKIRHTYLENPPAHAVGKFAPPPKL